MKLTNVKDLGFLGESTVPVTMLMTLREIVNAGKITNSAQTFMVATLIQFLKNEGPATVRNINEYHPMSADIEIVKALPAAEQVALATWLINILSCWSSAIALTLHNPEQDLIDWINLVLRKQD